MLVYKKQDWFDDTIFCYLQQEILGNVYSWPDGVVVEEAETKPCDAYGKWSESIVRVMVDNVLAAEIKMGGKHGNSIQDFTIKNKEAIIKLFSKIITI